MPYTTHWKGKGFHVNFSGLVSNDEVLQASIDMEADERFDSLRYMLSDFSAIDDLHFEADKFTKEILVHATINKAASKTNAKIKRAIVATHETVIMFANLYTAEASFADSPWDLKIFSTIEAAENWVQT